MLSALIRSLGRSPTYALLGFLLSLGAPAGLLILRAFTSERSLDSAWAAAELGRDPLLYGYLLLATAIAMSVVGWVVGRYETALSMLSDLDPLTRLPNRRGFDAALSRELSRAARDGAPLTALMIDLDRFKRVNDRYGHAAGDAALLQLSQCLRAACRKTDVPARYGGDEFAVLLPATPATAARRLAQRLAATLRASEPVAPSAAPLTVSIGIAQFDADGPGSAGDEDGTALMMRADRALYAAKAAGRDRSVIASGDGASADAGGDDAPQPPASLPAEAPPRLVEPERRET